MNEMNGKNGMPIPRGSGYGELSAGSQRLSPSTQFSAMPSDVSDDRDVLLNPMFLLAALRQWWLYISALTIVLGAASIFAIWCFFKPVYRAGAMIHIAEHAPYLAYDAARHSMSPEDYVQTQIELLRSRVLLTPVLAKESIKSLPDFADDDDPVGQLSSKLRISRIGKSEMYTVSLESHDPQASAQIVNEVVNAYFELLDKESVGRGTRMVELLEQEKQKRAKDVAKLREKMRVLSAKIPGQDVIASISGTPVIRENPLGDLRERLTEAEVERQFLQMKLKSMQETLPEAKRVPEAALALAVEDSEEMATLRAQIVAKKAMLPRIEVVAAQGKEDVSYRRLMKEIEQLERSLAVAMKETKPKMEERMSTFSTLNRKEEIRLLEEKLASQKDMEDILRARYESQRSEYKGTDNVALELEFLRSELEREEKVFELIAERSTAFTTEMKSPGRVTLIDSAHPPEQPIEEVPLKYMALALLASMGVSSGSALLLERSVRRIRDCDQLNSRPALALIGEIASLPSGERFNRGKISRREPWGDTLYEESIDSLRTSILFSPGAEATQVIAICSAVQGEGKTNLSSRLAVSLARCSREPTLIIDSDVRAPDIHRLFDVPRSPGFVELVAGKCSLEEAIVTNWSDQVPTLHILPAGKLNMTPHELMGSYDLASTIAELRKRYRFIVFDTAPVLAASEALILAKHCDGVVLSTLRNRSREHQVTLAFERLRDIGAPIMGVVLSAVSRGRYTSTYGNYPYKYRRETST